MSWRIHGSAGTPDMMLGTEAELADQHVGYYADDEELDNPQPRLFLYDEGNQDGWVIELPDGSDDLYQFARHLEQLADQLRVRERVGTRAGWCACGRELLYADTNGNYVHADTGTFIHDRDPQ